MPSSSSKRRKVQKKQRGEKRREVKKQARTEKKSKFYLVSVFIKSKYTFKEREKYGAYFDEDRYNEEFEGDERTINTTIAKFVNECRRRTEDRLKNSSPVDDWEIVDVRWTKEMSKEPTDLTAIKMKNKYRLDIDGCYDQWDKQLGTCVYDYIVHRYGKIKGFIKTCRDIEALNKFFVANGIDDGLTDGLCTRDIEIFCRHFRLPLYALDENERVFYTFTPEKPNHHAPSLAYRMLNNHFYPVVNNTQIRSIVETIKCESGGLARQKVPDNKKEEVDVPIEIYKDGSTFDFLREKMEETNTMPFPFHNIKFNGTDITSFTLRGKKYVYDANADMSKTLCENMNIPYKGQGLSTLLIEIMKEVLGETSKSTMNPHTLQTLISEGVKNRVHYGLVEDFTDDHIRYYHKEGKAQICDINRHYTNCMYNPIEDWMVLDFNDEWETYSGGEIPFGLYYVETDDTTLLHKTNIYSSAIVKYALKEKIPLKIVAQLKASKRQTKDYFKPVIDKIKEYSKGEKVIEKFMCNMMSGMLGRHCKTTHRLNINSDFKQVFTWFERNACKKRMIADTMEVNGVKYYMYGTSNDTLMTDNNIPMYIQIKDVANIRLYELVKKMGGKLAFRKTDMAITIGGAYPELSEKWGGYKDEKLPKVMGMARYDDLKGFKIQNEWKVYDINDSSEWQNIFKIATEKGGLLLTGEAGTGKTFVSKNGSKTLERVKRLAPTHKACLVLGGGATTIHSFLKMNTEGKVCVKWVKEMRKRYKYIVIDEISMINKHIWRLLVEIKRMTGLTFILIGDPRQCKPIEYDEGVAQKELKGMKSPCRDYFNHSAVKYLTGRNKVELTVVHRYDMELKKRLGDLKPFGKKAIKPSSKVNICFYNTTRVWVNHQCNMAYKTDDAVLVKHDEKDKLTQDVYLHKGLPIISRKTLKDGSLLNNEEYVVKDINGDVVECITSRVDDEGQPCKHIVEVKLSEIQFYFLMAYCYTTHKAQGSTFTMDYTIWDWDAMESDLKYTALSRATKVQQVSFGEGQQPDVGITDFFKKKMVGHSKYDDEKGYANDLTLNYVVGLFNRQRGCCCWCGCDLNVVSKVDTQASIDRLDDRKGHTKDNVVISCWSCNRNHLKTVSM